MPSQLKTLKIQGKYLNHSSPDNWHPPMNCDTWEMITSAYLLETVRAHQSARVEK